MAVPATAYDTVSGADWEGISPIEKENGTVVIGNIAVAVW